MTDVLTVPAADLFAWWQMSMERAYKVAKSRHSRRLRGYTGSTFDKDGVDEFSKALGRVQMCENLMPDLHEAWIADGPEWRRKHPDWSKAKLIDEEAKKDAIDEFRNEVLLAAIATGEVEAPSERAAA